MYKDQLRDLIERTLRGINKYSPEAVNLLMGTCAQESRLGVYIKQLSSGPALGVFQMEPFTFNDIVNCYLAFNESLAQKIKNECDVSIFKSEALEYNLKLAICFTRVHYLRFPEPLPNDLDGMARIWKKRYNTILGAGSEEEFIKNYERYLL